MKAIKKIVLATGIYPPEVGGPATYVYNLEQVLMRKGYMPVVVTYTWEKRFPTGIRHIIFFTKLFFKSIGADALWAFDTFSAGMPALYVSQILRKQLVVRVGGDFLWEWYVERTKEPILLSEFYNTKHQLTIKERIIFYFVKVVVRGADKIIFSTEWMKDIWEKGPYTFSSQRAYVVLNAYEPIQEDSVVVLPDARLKIFVSPTRPIVFKNKKRLHVAFENVSKKYADIILEEETLPRTKHLKRLMHSYAVLLPSLSEVSPNLLLDALSVGKPAVVTKDCGYADMCPGGVVLVDPTSTESIAEGIEKLLDPALYASCVEAIKQFHFSHTYDEIADECIHITQSI